MGQQAAVLVIFYLHLAIFSLFDMGKTSVGHATRVSRCLQCQLPYQHGTSLHRPRVQLQKLIIRLHLATASSIMNCMKQNDRRTMRAGERAARSGAVLEKILGGGVWPLNISEATTAKRNYYRTNYINHRTICY